MAKRYDYYPEFSYFHVPYTLLWADWIALMEEEPYYDVWG